METAFDCGLEKYELNPSPGGDGAPSRQTRQCVLHLRNSKTPCAREGAGCGPWAVGRGP